MANVKHTISTADYINDTDIVINQIASANMVGGKGRKVLDMITRVSTGKVAYHLMINGAFTAAASNLKAAIVLYNNADEASV